MEESKVFDLLTRTATQPEAHLAPPPIQVETKHIPFIEPLWNKIEETKRVIALKEGYIKTVDEIGLDIESIRLVREQIEKGRQGVAQAETVLRRIKMALAAGCEPATPPTNWFVGHLNAPSKDGNGYHPRETWPGYDGYYVSSRGGALTFTSAIPAEALVKYADLKGLFDDTRVYSPNKRDFMLEENPAPRDPVILGMIELMKEKYYFEIVRWDITEDLAAIFKR